jgi:DNA-binding response OmpR family regulator
MQNRFNQTIPDNLRELGQVLLLSTNDDLALALRAQLQETGYGMLHARDPDQGIKLYELEQPDFIFLDIEIPKSDRFTSITRIKSAIEKNQTSIILIANSDEEKVLSRCMDAGGDDFLIQPFSSSILSSKLTALERTNSLHREYRGLYNQILKDEEFAENLFSNAVVAGNVALHHIATLLRPAELFSGDVLLTAHAPSRDINVLLGDFTGHGLSAALGALPTSEVFRAMTSKGFSPQQILSGINRKLHSLLPTGMFFAVQFLSVSNKLDYITVCNCGMPDMLLLDGVDGGIKQRFHSRSLPLGIDPDVDFSDYVEHVSITPGDVVLLLSDGVSEAQNHAGEFFGCERLAQAINDRGRYETALDRIAWEVGLFCKDAPQADDISLAEIPCTPDILAEWGNLPARHEEVETTEAPGDMAEFSLTLTGTRLRQADPIPLIINHIQELEGLQTHRRLLFTILTELYVNALDHGVLQLDSEIKHSADGFSRYFEEREKRLGSLSEGKIKIQIRTQPLPNGGRMSIRVEDSGKGFDFQRYLETSTPQDESKLAGRGIHLIRELCENIHYEEPGNKVEIYYAWSNE